MLTQVALALAITYADLDPDATRASVVAIARRDGSAMTRVLADLSLQDINCVAAAVIEPELSAFRAAVLQARETVDRPPDGPRTPSASPS